MENKEIRDRMRIADIRCWQVAQEVGIAAPTFSTWLRAELSEERRQRVTNAIEAIIARRGW